MSKFFKLIKNYNFDVKDLTKSQYDLMGDLSQHVKTIEMHLMTDQQQDQLGAVYTELTGSGYDKYCRSCQGRATIFLREAIQKYESNNVN